MASSSKQTIFLYVVGLLAVTVVGVAAGYRLAPRAILPRPVMLVSNPELLNTVPTVITNVPVEPQAPSSFVSPFAFTTKKVSLPADLLKSATWYAPKRISGLGLLVSSSLSYTSNSEESSEYYSVATFNYADKSGQVVLLSVPGEMGGPYHYLIADYNQQFVILSKYGTSIPSSTDAFTTDVGAVGADGFLLEKISVDYAFTIPKLEFPKTIISSKPRQVLEFQNYFAFNENGFFINIDAAVPAFIDPVWGEVLMSTSSGGFRVGSVGNFYAVYKLKPDFFDADDLVPQITWNNGVKNTNEYAYTSVGGCGSSNYIAVVAPQEISLLEDLVVAGKNNQGDSIYEFKNANHPYLKKVYDEGYWTYPNDKKEPFDSYIASRPLIYWVDPFGRLIELKNKKFVPQAECGKPVIYLYPEKTTPVSVQLEPQGGFSYTEPVYQNGWSVMAEPNGQLTEIATSKQYPYLFWEGRGGLYETPKQGWVVKKGEVEKFLKNKLTELGLNTKESADFMEFWLPKMQEKPYYFITFLGNATMDRLAPLSVDPKPDTIIRLLMDFTPLDHPINVEPFRIRTPVRRGFTVVEWGGVLR